MRHECIQAVAKALGKELTQVETQDIEQRLKRNMRELARSDPQAWLAKSKAQKMTEAAQRAAAELVHEARLKLEREALQIAANAKYAQYKADSAAAGVTGLEALDRKIVFHSDGKTKGMSVERWARGVREDLLRQLIPIMEASNPKWFGLIENKEGVEAIIKEIHGEDSGDATAKAGAKIWHDVTEAARQRFNASGGDIGKLDDWGMPHHHSQVRVARAGREEWLATLPKGERLKAQLFDRAPPASWSRGRWIADILPRLDRSKYVREDGTRMPDAEVTEFLEGAWTTIATGGANKWTPGEISGSGARANRGNASRQVHFKDAQNYFDYQTKFGERSLFEVLTGHIEGVSKDIAMVEEFGPNPDAAFRLHRDQAVQESLLEAPALAGKIHKHAIRSENYYNIVSGKTQPVASERLAKNFDTLRNWLAASRLGGAVISSFSDEATLHLTARLNNLSTMRLLANELATLNPANRMEERLAMRAGLGLNTFIASLNRFGADSLGVTFSKKMSNTVMRAQGLSALTDARRRAFGVTMMDALGNVVREHADLSRLDPVDNKMLLQKGVTDTDFAIWKQADAEDWGDGNAHVLTPESIYRIPDAKLDQAIGPQLKRLKDNAAKAIADLKARDVEDAGWVSKRAGKLSTWLAKARAKVDARIAKADAGAQAELTQVRDRIGKLEETVEATRASWETPIDENTPGVDNQKKVGFYGKPALRRKGFDEGRAKEGIKNLERSLKEIQSDLKKTKLAELEGLFEAFHERRAEFDEFTKDSARRVARRGKVVDRITREIDPAIARARVAAREQAATRLLAAVLEETDVAVIEPGAKERAFMGAGIQRGTWKGELAKSFFLFKSFPLAMVTRHWHRGMAQATPAQRATYLSTLLVTTTLLGAASMQVKEVLAGRDPRNLNPFKDHGMRNWMKAMLQGGSLGLYGDFLFSESTQRGQSPVASFLGPVVGLGEDAFKLTQGNIVQASQGKETHFGAEATRFVSGNLPGANLWYTKAILDHMIFHRMQEYFSPGYLRQMRRRAEREFGQSYWWEPGEVAPDRAPDLEAVAGK